MKETTQTEQQQTKEPKATHIGIALLLTEIILFFVVPALTSEEIVSNICYAIVAVFKIGALFYGLTLIKKLNRNYAAWAVLVFFFTAPSLIVLGQLPKLKKEIVIIKLDTSWDTKNVNKLPSLTLATNSSLLIEAVQNDSLTLKHMIINYPNYIKENTSLLPILAAYQLNKRAEILDVNLKTSLDKFANEKGHTTFNSLLESINNLTPEEICMAYN